MCLVAVYLQQPDGAIPADPAFNDVARLECKEGEVIITCFLGKPQSIRGRVRSVDLVDDRVIIEAEGSETGRGEGVVT